MDTWFIYGVSGEMLDRGRDSERRKDVAAEIGELILRALEAGGGEQQESGERGLQGVGVRFFCDLDDDEIATYIWSGGKLQALDAAPDIDLRETLDSVEREVVARWKRSHPGYEFVIEGEG